MSDIKSVRSPVPRDTPGNALAQTVQNAASQMQSAVAAASPTVQASVPTIPASPQTPAQGALAGFLGSLKSGNTQQIGSSLGTLIESALASRGFRATNPDGTPGNLTVLPVVVADQNGGSSGGGWIWFWIILIIVVILIMWYLYKQKGAKITFS